MTPSSPNSSATCHCATKTSAAGGPTTTSSETPTAPGCTTTRSSALNFEIFSPAGDEDQRVILHIAEPGSPSERGLHQLARWATEASSPLRRNSAALGS
ncbi:MAG TPA: hypothetical protein VGA04_05555 [Streptosporangiaceae bacterium]